MFSALFAVLTVIFAKIGIKGVDTYLATALRTIMILLFSWGIAFVSGGTKTIGTLTSEKSMVSMPFGSH